MKWYYVTGCDSGFGSIVTALLEKAGHGVFAGVYLQKSIAKLNSKHSKNVVPVLLDVTDEKSVDAAAQAITDHLGEGGCLDGLVNNAGILVTPGPTEWTPNSAYERMMKVNVFGMAFVTKSVLPLIRKAQGRIVNVASIAGRLGLQTQPAYCASKFAVEGYSDVLRKDMLAWGVTVHIIEPGVYPNTGLYDTWKAGLTRNWESQSDAVKKDYGEKYYQVALADLDAALKMPLANKDSSEVPLAMVHALTSVAPKYRYRCGKDSKYLVTPLCLVHESTQDAFLKPPTPNHPAAAPADGKLIATKRYEKSHKARWVGALMVAALGYSQFANIIVRIMYLYSSFKGHRTERLGKLLSQQDGLFKGLLTTLLQRKYYLVLLYLATLF